MSLLLEKKVFAGVRESRNNFVHALDLLWTGLRFVEDATGCVCDVIRDGSAIDGGERWRRGIILIVEGIIVV